MHTRSGFCATTNTASTEGTSFIDLLASHKPAVNNWTGKGPRGKRAAPIPAIPVLG